VVAYLGHVGILLVLGNQNYGYYALPLAAAAFTTEVSHSLIRTRNSPPFEQHENSLPCSQEPILEQLNSGYALTLSLASQRNSNFSSGF
jgi:hypothetical protein